MNSQFDSHCLDGKVALVTGGGSGIGFEIAKQLRLHGVKGVLLMGRREDVLKNSADSLSNGRSDPGCNTGGVTYFVGDVRQRESALGAVKACLLRYGRLDILVNGAAGNFLAKAGELSIKGFRTVLDIDTIGTFNMCTAALPAFQKGGGGSVINISMTLHYGATWYQSHACAAKAGVDSLTRSLALEWGQFGIRVNGIAPGAISDTQGMAKIAPSLSKEKEATVPLGRLGRAWDCAMAAVFIASPAASYISGHTIVVDGGGWLYKPPMIGKAENVSAMSRSLERRSKAAHGPSKHTSSRSFL